MEQRLILLRFFWRIVTCYPFNQPGFHGNATLEFQILNKAHFWNSCVPTNLNTDLGGLSIRISPICANSWGLKPDWWIARSNFNLTYLNGQSFHQTICCQLPILDKLWYSSTILWGMNSPCTPKLYGLTLRVLFHYPHPSPVQWGVIQTRRLAPSKGSMRWWGILGDGWSNPNQGISMDV